MPRIAPAALALLVALAPAAQAMSLPTLLPDVDYPAPTAPAVSRDR